MDNVGKPGFYHLNVVLYFFRRGRARRPLSGILTLVSPGGLRKRQLDIQVIQLHGISN